MSGDRPSAAHGELPTAQGHDAPAPLLTTLRATVVDGPDEGMSFLVEPASPQPVSIGTSAACELRLSDVTVSRRHASIEPIDGRFRVYDLGSTNGTFINNIGVTGAFVRGGETLRCGSTVLRLEATPAAQTAETPAATRFGRTLGASEVMRRLYPLCARIAATRVPVLIEGEMGTGKELLAESLHDAGSEEGPFIVYDCATVPPALAEVELFGRAQGAEAEYAGAFELSHGGTLFIDEIGNLAPALQPKLLRALDRGEIRRVGGKQAIRVDVRVVVATRRDLEREVAAGRFSDDLYHRIAAARIRLPPLRERRGDIKLLAQHFAERFGASPAGLPAEVMAQLDDYTWPGNVRELQNAVAQQVAVGEVALGRAALVHATPGPASPGGRVDGGPDEMLDQMIKDSVPFSIARNRVIESFERRYVAKILAAHGGSVARASAASGVALRYFQVLKAKSLKG